MHPLHTLGEPIICPKEFDFAQAFERTTLDSLIEYPDFDGLAHQLPATSEPQPLPTPLSTPSTAKAGKNRRAHKRRAHHRQKAIENEGHTADPQLTLKHLGENCPVRVDVESQEFPTASGAYTAKPQSTKSPAITGPHNLSSLLEVGFALVRWDGSNSRPIVDRNNRVVAALVGTSNTPGVSEAGKRILATMLKEGEAAEFLKQEIAHKRGEFPAINFGITHGQGGRTPVNLRTPHEAMLLRLLDDPDFQRMASLCSSTFAHWAPKLYDHYKKRLLPLWAKYPDLRRLFRGSIFPTTAFNFGPRVCTQPHRDHLNCPYGWCVVQSFGSFDPTRGGHLILWEAKLVVEFPAHSIIFLPSAVITHSNLPVDESESRISITHYCPGALLRFVDSGMRTDKDFHTQDPAGFTQHLLERQSRWNSCLDLLPVLDDLKPTTVDT